jgi:hypothetical protein
VFDKYIVTAKLQNGKQVVLDAPDYGSLNIGYRYMTDQEIALDKLDTSHSGIQLYAPIYKTIEDGQTILFTVIEATPIILNRFQGV